jgi:uncharacterized protein (TIGR02145 family)
MKSKKLNLFISLVLSFIFDISNAQTFVKDVDGNSYKTVIIGNQLWFAENLKTTKFNDSTKIPLVSENSVWCCIDTPGYCWYNNDSVTYASIYGALYNWYSVNTDKLCPSGWHVPTFDDWSNLINYLGSDKAGDKLRETGTSHWAKPNKSATNKSGFTALPGGFRPQNGTFEFAGKSGDWWSDDNRSLIFGMFNFDSYLEGSISDKGVGCSVRCIKD